jgi:rRNA maturation protein Nop10
LVSDWSSDVCSSDLNGRSGKNVAPPQYSVHFKYGMYNISMMASSASNI